MHSLFSTILISYVCNVVSKTCQHRGQATYISDFLVGCSVDSYHRCVEIPFSQRRVLLAR